MNGSLEVKQRENPVSSNRLATNSRSDKSSIDFAAAYRVLMQAYVRSIGATEDGERDRTQN